MVKSVQKRIRSNQKQVKCIIGQTVFWNRLSTCLGCVIDNRLEVHCNRHRTLHPFSSFGRLQTIPQQEFLHWMWNDTLFEPISLRSVQFWGRPLRVSYKRRFVLKQFVNQYPEGLLFWKLPPYPIAWFGILVWYSVLSSATRCSLKSESPTRTCSFE